MAQVELLPAEVKEWDDAMHAWTQARCSWRERSSGSLSRLYISHIEHAHQTGGMFAPDRETFVAILMALGFRFGWDGERLAIARRLRGSPLATGTAEYSAEAETRRKMKPTALKPGVRVCPIDEPGVSAS